MASAVIAAVGEDRPGLVNELSGVMQDAGLNIEDSRMTVLGGEFAVLMSVTGADPDLADVEGRLARFCLDAGLVYLFRPTTARSASHVVPYVVRVVAMDHPGIVRQIAGFFSGRGINIQELNTETEHAAHTGTPIFNLVMIVELPADLKLGALRSEFESFCDDENLDGSLTAVASRQRP